MALDENLYKVWKDWAKNQKETLGKKFLNPRGEVAFNLEIPYLHLTHLGGSSVGALMQVSKWETLADVYDKMTGAIDTSVPVHNFAFDRGHFCETFIYQQAGLLLHDTILSGDIYFDKDRPWSMAQVDALTSDNTPVECKCVSFNNITEDGKEWGAGCVINNNGEIIKEDDLVPVSYYLQCQKQMALTDKKKMFLAAWLTFETRIRIYVIHRDDDVVQAIKDAEDRFLFGNVISKIRPDVVVRGENIKDIDADKTVIADDNLLNLLDRYQEVNRDLKDLKIEADALKKRIEDGMGNAQFLRNKDGKKLATRTPVTTMRFNSTKFKDEHADLYGQYLTETKSTRFTISAKKD